MSCFYGPREKNLLQLREPPAAWHNGICSYLSYLSVWRRLWFDSTIFIDVMWLMSLSRSTQNAISPTKPVMASVWTLQGVSAQPAQPWYSGDLSGHALWLPTSTGPRDRHSGYMRPSKFYRRLSRADRSNTPRRPAVGGPCGVVATWRTMLSPCWTMLLSLAFLEWLGMRHC